MQNVLFHGTFLFRCELDNDNVILTGFESDTGFYPHLTGIPPQTEPRICASSLAGGLERDRTPEST